MARRKCYPSCQCQVKKFRENNIEIFQKKKIRKIRESIILFSSDPVVPDLNPMAKDNVKPFAKILVEFTENV